MIYLIVNDRLRDKKISQIGKRVSPYIEVFPVSEEEFANQENPFVREAIKTGKKLI